MDITKINELCTSLQLLTRYVVTQQPVSLNEIFDVHEKITSVAQQISYIDPSISNRLIGLKGNLFIENSYQHFYVNSIVYGQILEAMEVVKARIFDVNQANTRELCHLLHPDIKRVSEKLYRDGSYAEAACNAFIEIESRLKKLYHETSPNENIPSGQALMNRIFADNCPVLKAGDGTTQTEKDIQSGTRFLFAGAMAALRNPKSHENIVLEKDDCMRRLIFASMLMFKIDEIVGRSENSS